MKQEPDHAALGSSEIIVARLEIEELGDPAREREIIKAVAALDGVVEAKIENGALHVSYDPLLRLKRNSSRLSAAPGIQSKPRPQRLRIQGCQAQRLHKQL